MSQSSQIQEPVRSTPVVRHADVVVCGGGPAGVSAALAAAISGADTVLIENAGCLGGVWTSGLLTYVLDPKGDSPMTQKIIAELASRTGYTRRHYAIARDVTPAWAEHSFIYDPEVMKWTLEQLCLQYGVQVRLHTRVCDVVKSAPDGRSIAAVLTESKSGREAWCGKVFIDTTGDGDVAARAGCGFALGRPENGEVQPLTLLCLVQTPFPERVQPIARRAGVPLREAIERTGIIPSYGWPVLFEIRPDLYGFMMNHHHGSAVDATEISEATFRARDEVMRAIIGMREAGGIWEGLQVVATADHIGVREGRRIRGRYEITVEDLINGREHADAVCRVHFPIDVHSTTKGVKQTAFGEENQIKSKPYDVPMRSLIAADLDNLLMAGRNISGDFLAHSSYRVTGNSVAMGEAAGAFAAGALREGEAVSTHAPALVKCYLEALAEQVATSIAP